MKMRITYEQDDLLRLIEADLRKTHGERAQIQTHIHVREFRQHEMDSTTSYYVEVDADVDTANSEV